MEAALKAELGYELPLAAWLESEPELGDEALLERVIAHAHHSYAAKVPAGAESSFHQYERYVMLQILDGHWREHLAALDHLRQGIHLRGYAQKNPKQEYKREAFELFGALLEAVKLEVTRTLVAVEIRATEEVPQADVAQHVENVRLQHADYEEALAEAAEPKKTQPAVRATTKVGRNEPCPCGSGKKYKHCHGKLA
jgi:preprotein translocase subunit SecA